MGKAVIVKNKSRAYYRVKIIKDKGQAPARISQIEQLLINSDSLLDRLSTALTALLSEEITLIVNYRYVVAQYRTGLATREDVINAKLQLLSKQEDIRLNRQEQGFIKLYKVSLAKEKTILENAIADEEINVWCVDYSDTIRIGTEVGLAELDGDFKWMNILGGGETSDAKGLMQPCACSTPSGTFLNLALMPCWQRWKPYYRAGVISNIDYKNNRCDVVIDNPNLSSATNICKGKTLTGRYDTVSINQFTTPEIKDDEGKITQYGRTEYKKVAIRYMNANCEAFLAGDYVIVEFDDSQWNYPVVIGFHDNPRQPMELIVITFYDIVMDADFITVIDGILATLAIIEGFTEELINNFAPAVISALPLLIGHLMQFSISYGMPWIWRRWTLIDIQNYLDYWSEMIGLPTSYSPDGSKRQYFRMNAVEYLASTQQAMQGFQTIKALQPIIAQYTYVTFTGHSQPSLTTPRRLLEGANLNFEVFKINEDLTQIKNPTGTSDWMKQRCQAIKCEEIWNKYAGEYMNGYYSTYWTHGMIYMSGSGDYVYKVGQRVRMQKEEGMEDYFPVELNDGGIYEISYVEEGLFLKLLDGDGNLITSYHPENPERSYAYCKGIDVDKAPVLHLKIDVNYYGYTLLQADADCMAVIDSKGEFIIILSDPVFYSSLLEITMTTAFVIYMWGDGQAKQALIELPTNLRYGAVHWSVNELGFADELELNMSISVESRLMNAPATFGGHYHVGSKTYTGSWMGDFTTWGVSWWADPFSYMSWWIMSDEEYTFYYQFLPTGFFAFASKYYDHPIITGQNDEYYNSGLTEDEKDAIVLYVNKYVNDNFTYRKDTGENWEFMGQTRTYGDCEDFALTKIDMCLKMGMSVKDFKFAYGYPSIRKGGSGHAWALYKGVHVLDWGDVFKTTDQMVAEGYVRLGGQSQGSATGLTWWYDETRDPGVAYPIHETITFPREKLWTYSKITANAITSKIKLKKMMR